MADYNDIAELFDNIAKDHERNAQLLRNRIDPEHSESNRILAEVETMHACMCRLASTALRNRQQNSE